MADHLERLQAVLRGLTAGTDPGQLLHAALAGAIDASGATSGAVLRAVGGSASPLATSGDLRRGSLEVAQDTIDSGRLTRRSEADANAAAAAEPLRSGGRVIGALVVQGPPARLEPGLLALYADAAALVVARRGTGAPDALPSVLEGMAQVASDLDTQAMLARIFDVAGTLFGAASGFCTLIEGSTVRVAHYRGIDHERMVAATRLPEFKAVASSSDVRMDPPSHPVVAQITRLSEVAVGLPLEVDGRRLGQLVLLVAHTPDSERRALLVSFARHVALSLRSALLHQRLGEHQEQLASMVHSMAHPVVVVDSNGRLVEVNGAAAEAFRIANTFEVGQPVVGRLGHRGLEAMLAKDEDAAAEVVLGTDEPRVYRAVVRRMRSATGRPLGRILVMDDLTTEREADALKTDFVAVIGHELRTPLTVIKGYLHTLIKRWDTLTAEKRDQAFAAVHGNVSRLERLIEDLLFVSAIEQRRVTLELELHNLCDVLDERASDRVSIRRPRRPVDLEIDRTKLEQVLHHLLDNALKYSEGEVVLELAEGDDSVEISIADAGPGIYSGDVPHLFERFRQLDGTSTRSHGGVGIGLYICRRMVEAWGGRIWCESRLGVGSLFAFTIPKHGGAQEPALDPELNVSLP